MFWRDFKNFDVQIFWSYVGINSHWELDIEWMENRKHVCLDFIGTR